MNVNHPGLGAYDAVERQMHRDAPQRLSGGDYDAFQPHIVKSPQKARSGIISGHVLAVLVGSTTLAIIALCAVLAVTV